MMFEISPLQEKRAPKTKLQLHFSKETKVILIKNRSVDKKRSIPDVCSFLIKVVWEKSSLFILPHHHQLPGDLLPIVFQADEIHAVWQISSGYAVLIVPFRKCFSNKRCRPKIGSTVFS